MSTELARRQQALVEALLGRVGEEAHLPGLRALPGVEGGVARGLQAYRLHARALSARALASVFTGVQHGLGEDDFAAMAWAFWRHSPPRQGDLALWGEALPGFLQAQPGMERALVDRARLDWALHQCERATDVALEHAALQRLGDTDPARLQLRLRPGLCVLRELDEGQALPAARLVWRREWRARERALAPGEAAFFEALLAGRDLDSSLRQALGAQADFDFTAWLQQALAEEWLWTVLSMDTSE